MCDIAEGTNAVESTVRRRARIPHECDACEEAIHPGDEYIRTSVLYDGHWDDWKHCLRCDAIYRALLERADSSPDHLHIEPGLDCGSSWLEAWGESPPPEVEALAFAIPSDLTPQTRGARVPARAPSRIAESKGAAEPGITRPVE